MLEFQNFIFNLKGLAGLFQHGLIYKGGTVLELGELTGWFDEYGQSILTYITLIVQTIYKQRIKLGKPLKKHIDINNNLNINHL